MNYQEITLEHLASIVATKLKSAGIESVLVGGACVSIYSHNQYQSYDLDFVTYEDIKKVSKALLELGFQKQGQYFKHAECPYFLEFVSPPVAIGQQPIHQFEQHHTPFGTIQMLTPTDSIKDRLAAYFHWNDQQSLDQATTIYKEIPHKVNLQQIKQWSEQEGFSVKYRDFLNKIN